jgi:phosphatidylglycerophosphatase A
MSQQRATLHFLVATWFGAGRSPKAPGTVGSLAALPFAWLLVATVGAMGLLIAAALVFAIGVWASAHHARTLGSGDPGEIVVDEVVGQWIAVLALPLDPLAYAVAFVTFRVFDIAKPWPIRLADEKLKGGFGIMADDVLAGLAALAVSTGLWFYFGAWSPFTSHGAF